MSTTRNFFEFLYEHIEIQIQKYIKLASIGVGPDAGMNAKLVHDQVSELLGFANQLLEQGDEDSFTQIFSQVKFYWQQEYLRGYAGWLIDTNKIHNSEMVRLNTQKELIDGFSKKIEAKEGSARTVIQKQCEFDSNAIAHLILKLAIDIKANPEMKLDERIPKHAQQILRKHASGGENSRYNKPEIWDEIQTIYTKCSNFLSQSTLSKSTKKMTKESAVAFACRDEKAMDLIYKKFKAKYPDSILQKKLKIPHKKTFSTCTQVLFRGGIVLCAAASLFFYLTKDQSDSSAPGLRL